MSKGGGRSLIARSSVGGTSLAALAIGTQGLPRAFAYQSVRRRFPGLEGHGRSDHVALTFDDGPDPHTTPALLEQLAALEVRVTFFVLGLMVMHAREMACELVSRGHEVAIHGWDHNAYFRRGPLRIRSDLARTSTLILRELGVSPRFYRPPYGKLTGSSLWAAHSLGLRTVLWTAWGEDWLADATGRSVLDALEPDLCGGATILLHDSDSHSAPGSWRATADAIAPLVHELRARGLEVGPLCEHGLEARQRWLQ
jgi:peptidoglycan/xylan/chitin deacetylase (PgdA/CDA1 family)